MSLSIVLLAAGEGKRMKTNLPKPLVMLGSDPLVQHSLNTIKIMKPEKIILVTGFKKDEVKKYVLSNNSGDFIFCEQIKKHHPKFAVIDTLADVNPAVENHQYAA